MLLCPHVNATSPPQPETAVAEMIEIMTATGVATAAGHLETQGAGVIEMIGRGIGVVARGGEGETPETVRVRDLEIRTGRDTGGGVGVLDGRMSVRGNVIGTRRRERGTARGREIETRRRTGRRS